MPKRLPRPALPPLQLSTDSVAGDASEMTVTFPSLSGGSVASAASAMTDGGYSRQKGRQGEAGLHRSRIGHAAFPLPKLHISSVRTLR